MKNEKENLLHAITYDESNLIFDEFNINTALDLGALIYKKALSKNLNLAFDFSINRRRIYHVSMDGCSVDNEYWLDKKINMVYRFAHSSLFISTLTDIMGVDLFEFYNLNSDYAPIGGGFPITVRGAGVVGCIALGGMIPEEDHNFIVDCLYEYLNIEKKIGLLIGES